MSKRVRESGGVMAANPREGFRSEALARFALSAFGPATDIEVEDDHGVDLLCATATVVNRRLHVGESYVVQVKSEAGPIMFSGPHSHSWLASLGSPLFIAIVDKGLARLKLYTTWNLSRFLMQEKAWGNTPPDYIRLIPDEPVGVGDGEIPTPDAIGLGPPIADFTVTDLADEMRRADIRDCIAAWVEREHENLNRRKVGLTFAFGYSSWVPNKVPEDIHLLRDHCFGPVGANRARKIIADAATLIAMLEKRGGGKAGERDALAAYFDAFTDFGEAIETLWSQVMKI